MLYGGRNVRFTRSAPCITAKGSIKESGIAKVSPLFGIAKRLSRNGLELL